MKKYFTLLLLAGFIHSASSQVIQVFEQIKNVNEEIKLNESNIIDINSRLEVRLNKDLLIEKANKKTGLNENLSAGLDQLNFILENQIEILKILENKIENASQKQKIAELGVYSELMAEFYKRLTSKGNEELRIKANGYFNKFWELEEANNIDLVKYPSPQTYVIKRLAEDANDILLMMSDSDEFQTLTFQLVAFINTKTEYQRKVHIENFDNYVEGEFYEVEKWVTSFSDEDKKAFEETAQLAGTLNEMLDKDINNLNELLQNSFQSIKYFSELIQKTQELYQKRHTIFDSVQLSKNDSFLKDLNTDFLDIQKVISKLDSYINLSEVNIDKLDSFNAEQQSFIDSAERFPKKLKDLKDQLAAKIVDPPKEVTELLALIDKSIEALDADIKTVKTIGGITANIIDPFKKTAKAADDIEGMAFNFSIDDLPDVGYINLKTTGKRQNGDELEIKLKLRTAEDKEKERPGETIELRTFVMQQIKVYSLTKVTLILAVPPADANIALLEKNKMQFAPSGSLLFKFGSRKSKAWNFLAMGAGFNISTPDFDLNGTPDVAMGAIVTILKDVVSFGYSYNTSTNTPFWFVGLSIPVRLPGIPINNVQAEKVQ